MSIKTDGINSPHETAIDVCTVVAKDTIRAIRDEEDLVARVKEARAALDEMSDSWKVSWLDWLEQSKTILSEFRTWRMAMTAEGKIVTNEFAEVRKFFLSKDHAEEIQRLNEFVTLCERLQALKASGFLDTITTTILKLDE